MPLTYKGQPLADFYGRAAAPDSGRDDPGSPVSAFYSPHTDTSDDDARPAKPSARWPMVAALAGGAADVATTQRGLARGGREANPLLPQGRVANGIALSAAYIADAVLAKLLNDHGHDRVAKWLGYGAGADGAAFAIHNMGAVK